MLSFQRLSVINLFDVAKNFRRSGGNQWLLDRYMSGQQQRQSKMAATNAAAATGDPAAAATEQPFTPPPTYVTSEMLRDSAPVTIMAASPQKEATLE